MLVFLDDDAWFEAEDCIETIVASFAGDSELGILAFKVVLRGYDEGQMQVPFSRRARLRHPGLTERRGQTTYYVGAGHAISSRVFEKCGLYQQDLVYGHEELDLAYDAVKKGFRILYVPEVVVSHEPGRSVIDGRMGQREVYYSVWNRIWVG